MSERGGVALVTGAGRGIGRSIALRLARDGFDVAINDVAVESADAVVREVEALGRRAVAVPADVSDRDAVFAMVAATTDALGDLDVIVANAGIVRVKPLIETTPDDLQAMFAVNLFGVFYCVQAAAEHFIARGAGGKIVIASSAAGHEGFEFHAAYSGTKFAVNGLTQAAAKELAPHGVTVNAYCPGIVDTPMWSYIDGELGQRQGKQKGETMAEYAKNIRLGRIQTPEDVAGLVAYFASPDSDYMTGQSLIIDGGIVFR
ncbi:MAG TPA: acetoin reductase [Conexibacter sp.]|nr:acetoin reductase [Conexibacter sp.]